MRSTIKVLVVDDSALIRQMLTRVLSVDPAVEVIGSAKTGVEAIEKAYRLNPDVVTLDIEMPELSGLEALPHIIKSTPARVVMLSALSDADTTYQALECGATDFLVKPSGGFASSLGDLTEELLKKIKIAYRVSPAHRTQRDNRPNSSSIARTGATVRHDLPINRMVAIAASTGGPPALETVFSGLTSELPAAYVIVQHLPKGFTVSLGRRLSRVTDIEIAEVENGLPIRQGVAYLAPHGAHMRIAGRKSKRLELDDAPSMHGVRPAADPLLESVATTYGAQSIGVILTGMGQDGALGLKQIRDAGGETIAQDEATSVVWGMPSAAIKMGAASRIVPLPAVSAEIRRLVRG